MNKSFLATYKEVQRWFRKIPPELIVDVETDGLRWNCQLKGVSFCDGTRACYINLENNYDKEKILDCIGFRFKLMWWSNSRVIGHNLVFDLRVLEQNGIKWDGRIYDTMVASHLLNENDSCALKEVVKRREYEGYENAITFKEAAVNGYNSEIFLNYAINDAIWTWMLYKESKPLIDKDFEKLFYEVEMPFQYVLIDLYKNGIKVDTKKLEEIDDSLTAQLKDLEEKMVESLGMKMIVEKSLFGWEEIKSPVNFDSPKQVKEIIENKLNLKLPYKTKGGKSGKKKPSTGKRSLERLKGKHPFIDMMLDYNSLSAILSTFVKPIYGLLDSDGRLRTSFNDCGTIARLSSSEPNLQNLPKDLKRDINKIRSLFVVEDGHKLVNKDYSGQELRMLGVVSEDRTMINAFKQGVDLHLLTANECFSLDLLGCQLIEKNEDYEIAKEKFKIQRHIGKNGINFPIIYGSTAYGISKNNNVSEEEAQRWINSFFSLYPDVKKAINKTKQELFRNGYVDTIFGRRRRITRTLDDRAIRQAFNFKIQGACADLLRMAMIKVRELHQERPDWGAKLVLTVHDDFSTEVKEEYAEECGRAEKEIMENVVNLSVDFPVDMKVVNNLGE